MRPREGGAEAPEWRERVAVFGDAEDNVLKQIGPTMELDRDSRGSISADNHLGYNSHAVGFTWASPTLISASGVGVDIACGNKAVGTGISVDEDLTADLPAIMDEIFERIDFGIGMTKSENVDHPVIEQIANSPVEFQRGLWEKAANQLGSTGGGNHYVDLFEDAASGELVVGVHFGSRGFGHDVCAHYVKEQGQWAPPTVFEADSGIGQEYLQAIDLAGAYAYAGRDVVVDKVLDILGVHEGPTWSVHNHHNFAWRETHAAGPGEFGPSEEFWVVRKGCTPAFPGQLGFVGATMGEDSVILRGTQAAAGGASFGETRDLQEAALYSTVHGAGRAMSRGEAAGSKKKRWTCLTRDCDWTQGKGEHKPEKCPLCGNQKLGKRWVRVREGAVDWTAEQEVVAGRGIELRGGAADEAPAAYKRLDDVLAAMGPTIEVLKTLRPIGVAMAPGHVAGDD